MSLMICDIELYTNRALLLTPDVNLFYMASLSVYTYVKRFNVSSFVTDTNANAHGEFTIPSDVNTLMVTKIIYRSFIFIALLPIHKTLCYANLIYLL